MSNFCVLIWNNFDEKLLSVLVKFMYAFSHS